MTATISFVNAHAPWAVLDCRDKPCLHRTAEWTEPDRGGHHNRHRNPQMDAACTLCLSCPVLEECRSWALQSPDPCTANIAGGMTAWERRNERARRDDPPIDNHGTYSGWRQHQRRGETPCLDCRAARNAYQAEYQRQRRAIAS